jgi:AraC family transcriptional regulator
MKTNIIDKPAMNIVGPTLHTSFKDGRNKNEIPPFFHKVLEDKILDFVSDRINTNQLCIFEMQQNNPDFDYTMGVEVCNFNSIPENMNQMVLPSSRYVTLKTIKRGPEDVGKAFEFIYKTWIPNSIYIPSGKPAFIYYDEEFFNMYNVHGYSGNPEATVYVPIKPLFIKKLLNMLRLKRFTN